MADPPTEPFTDAHVHFWDHAAAGLRWRFLEPGFDHPRLKGMSRLDAPRYTGAELLVEAGPAAPTRVVHVQCAQGDDATAETRWLDHVARQQGWPDALVCRRTHRRPRRGRDDRRQRRLPAGSWRP